MKNVLLVVLIMGVVFITACDNSIIEKNSTSELSKKVISSSPSRPTSSQQEKEKLVEKNLDKNKLVELQKLVGKNATLLEFIQYKKENLIYEFTVD